MTEENEFEQMARELNEALDIEPNASHTQRLVTIVRLRTQALRAREIDQELIETERERDQAEARLLEVLTMQATFIATTMQQAKEVQRITHEFQGDLQLRVAMETLDAFDLATAQRREQKDNGECHDLDDVARELSDTEDLAVTEGLAPLRAKLHTEDGPDPLGLVDTDPKPEVRMDFPDTNEEKVGSETTTDFVDPRNRVPFYAGEVPLDIVTENWMKETASGGTRDGD